jgi:DNA-binding MarR family transcriptional regulator
VDVAEQLYLALQHGATRLRQLDEELGLSPARFSVLATLRFAGSQRLGELARRESVAQPTMTQSVRGLEAAGLVVRRPAPGDGRGRVVELTARGRALVRRARARKIAWLDSVLSELPTDARAALGDAATAVDRAARAGQFPPAPARPR